MSLRHTHNQIGTADLLPRAICAGEGFAVRATGIVGILKTETPGKSKVRSPAISFISAPTPSAAGVGGLLALLPWRVLDAFSRFLSRLHGALAVCQDTARKGAKSIQDFILSARVLGLAAGVYGQHTDRREMKCPTKALKDSTK